MLSNVRAEREGDWSAHLMYSSKMLPYFSITNHTNYSRWMPVYILDMLELPPEIKSAFEKASFPLDKHPVASMIFGAIWALKKTSQQIRMAQVVS